MGDTVTAGTDGVPFVRTPVRGPAGWAGLTRWASPNRWDGWRRGPARVALEVAVVLVCAAEVLAWEHATVNSSFIIASLTVLAVIARYRWPVAAAVVAGPALGWTALLLTPLVLLFTAGQRERRDVVVVGLVAWTVVSSAALMTFQDYRYLVDDGPLRLVTDMAAAVAMSAGAAGLGRLVRTRREQAAALRELVAGRAREQALAEHAARADERAHLAREMHDVVASQVTLIAVQAAGLRMTPGVDERTRQIAETIRAAASQTTRELREVLTELRRPEAAPSAPAASTASTSVVLPPSAMAHGVTTQGAARASSPCLRALDTLWASAGCAGQLVVNVPDTLTVAEPVQHAAYRILQEGLTNAVRYAPGAVVRAGIELVASTLVVSVVNGPAPAGPAAPAAPAAAGASTEPESDLHSTTGTTTATATGTALASDLPSLSTGNGLAGVRERAESLRGHASWGPTDDGGYQLTAVLPISS
ncbi:sensor histidine kinase [Quadrisphaera granulorum]|uniref:sensor histidine kinase n=1 Tax=Quadrisphaera granulorum TaxID=317664 RepID=UPI000D6C72F2|nr:histidine kinase [Quadrisphaera granulorum]